MVRQAFIGLGTNLGDRAQNLADAVQRLAESAEVVKKSSIYETEPWGFEDQPKFLNLVVEIKTDLEPNELLDLLKEIEQEMGREETFRYGPRLIDLDILFYDDLIYSSDTLTIPHPFLHQRAFVLVPLNEIAPGFIHPELNLTISDIVSNIDTSGIKKLPAWNFSKSGMPDWGKRTYIMGIINLTPDSFSGDGLIQKENYPAQAIKQAEEFVQDGADILDLGAESSRPGSEPVSAETELARLLPVLEGLLKKDLPSLISIDTWKSKVAEKCLSMGADWVNDIWGLAADPDLASVAASHKAGIILMHNRSKSGEIRDLGGLGKSYAGAHYDDFMQEIKEGLQHSIDSARSAGIANEKIILDPGIGFGKSQEQNLSLINRLNELKSLGFPLLAGPSRKSFIGRVLDLPAEDREEGTAAAVAVCIMRGADIVRIHNVRMMTRVARMTDALIRA